VSSLLNHIDAIFSGNSIRNVICQIKHLWFANARASKLALKLNEKIIPRNLLFSHFAEELLGIFMYWVRDYLIFTVFIRYLNIQWPILCVVIFREYVFVASFKAQFCLFFIFGPLKGIILRFPNPEGLFCGRTIEFVINFFTILFPHPFDFSTGSFVAIAVCCAHPFVDKFMKLSCNLGALNPTNSITVILFKINGFLGGVKAK